MIVSCSEGGLQYQSVYSINYILGIILSLYDQTKSSETKNNSMCISQTIRCVQVTILGCKDMHAACHNLTLYDQTMTNSDSSNNQMCSGNNPGL